MRPDNAKKIVIVDDDRDFILITGSFLEKCGFSVVSAYSASAGMEVIKKVFPDIVILDVMMESMTAGFFLARELRNDPQTAEIPIILVTAIESKLKFGWKNRGPESSWLPVDAVIMKPVNLPLLKKEINRLFQENVAVGSNIEEE